ncbi:hypothetical protein [Streptococcus cuniculi]|uniref:Uncharacterized protein n=1 Tax=Streptococcus cuniculi TaxID=1432788 RepID=A0A4Y9JAE1_9STRE|nr:hypothetical protein [Streptococcus cuniculi]MBF0778160.1 hypothetical protein [Streptococcus cuniculi]TFU97902.1 hypothetical protein E4T82_05405 [Streptococcus cuniculi]
MTKKEFFAKLKNARSRMKLVQRLESELLDGLDLEDVPFCGTNSTNLQNAISCYIHYGELPLSGKLEDFWEPYKKAVED